MNQQQSKEYSNYYNRALTKNKLDIKTPQNSNKSKEQQNRQLSTNQFNQSKTKDFAIKNIAANQTKNQIADQDDVNPSPYLTASQDDIFLKKQSLTSNQLAINKKKDSIASSNQMKQRNHQINFKPSSNSLNFETKSAGSQQPLLKFGGLKNSIQVQANQGQKFDFLDQTDTMRSSIHNNLSNDPSPKLANTQQLSSNLNKLKITENSQQIYMKTQQKKQEDISKLSTKKPSSNQQAFQKQKQNTAVIQIPQLNQENHISRTVCSVQSTQSPIRKFQQFQEKQEKTLKKFGSVDCGQMIDYLHSQSVLQKPSNQTLINAQIQNYEIANKSNQNEAVKRLEYKQPLQNSQNKQIPIFQNSNSSIQIKLQQSLQQNENQKKLLENTVQEIRSPLSIVSKRVPGSCLAGGAAIQKLSKLEAKDQDEVNDVTEDENSEENQKTNNKIYSQENQPSISINNLLSLQSAPVTNLQTQFNSPNQDFRNYVENLQIVQDKNVLKQTDDKVYDQAKIDVVSNQLDYENQKLRDEFIKVKQELEFLKRKQKFRNNVSGMSLPVSDRCAITQLKSPKNGPFDQEIIQRTGKQGQVVLTFGNKNANYTEQQQEQNKTYTDEIISKNKLNQSQAYMKNTVVYDNIKMSDVSNINQKAYQSIDHFPDSIDLLESQKLKNKIGNVTQRYERQSNISQQLQSSDEKVKDNNIEQKQQTQQYQSTQTKKPPSHYVKTSVQDKSMKSKENIEYDLRNNEIYQNSQKQNFRNQNSHLLRSKKEKQSNTIDYNNLNKITKQMSRTNSYNEVEVVDMTDEIASSHYKIMQLKQENEMLRTVSSKIQNNIKNEKYQKSVVKSIQNKQSSQHKQNSLKQSYPKTQQQSIQEFKGSFQNKSLAHKNEKQESISIYGATIDQNSSRRHFLNTCKKSFGSDGLKLSNSEREVEYSASASNNSINESNSSHSQYDLHQQPDDKFNYKINSQYSQLASVRTKNRKRSIKNQVNASRITAQKNNGGPYQKIVEGQRNHNDEYEQNHIMNSIDRINSKSKPIAHIDLIAQNTIKKKDIKKRNSSISCKNQTDMTSQDEESDKKDHSFHKLNKSIQETKQKVQKNIISDCQKQILELQNQLKSLQLTQMPILMNNLSQQNVNGLLTPRDQQQILLQQQLQAYQLYQHNIMNPVSSPHTLQFSQTSGAPLTPFTPLSSQNLINQTSQFMQHQQPFLTNQNALNGIMQFNQNSAFEQYELQIQHLQNQIKEQQLQLQLQESQNQALQRNTINSPNEIFSQHQYQNFNDFQQNQFNMHQSEFNKNQAIFNQEKSIQSRPGSVQKQNVSLNTLQTYQAHQLGLQRVSQSIKLQQVQSGIQYNDTQNQSNFFTQNTEFARNIDADHQHDFENKNNQYEQDSQTDNRSRNDYKNLYKTQEIIVQKKENNQYSDFELVEIEDQENSLTKKVKQNMIGNSFDQYMQDDYGKYEDEELRAGIKIDENQQNKLKGTFAPSPDLLDQLRNFENNEMNKNQNFQTLKARDFDEKIQKNSSNEQISPDFKFSLHTENNQKNNKQLIIEHKQDKKDTLLVIGFDEQPKGVNPLSKKRQTLSKFQKQKGQEEYITVRDIDRLSKVQKQSILKQNIKEQKEISDQIINQDNDNLPQNILMEKKNKGDLIIIQDDVPNLQEFAKQRRGKLGEHFQRQNNKQCISPQPRRSDALKNDELPPKSNKRFDKQDEEQPSKREEKSQPKTKEELAEIRKKWMKTKFKDRVDPRNPLSNIKSQNEENKQIIEINNFAKQRDISTSQQLQESKNMDLMLRLASGQKVKVDEKSMKKLTNKNYEKLPEIIKKKAEQKKQQELEERKNKYASYQKELKERLRNEMIKKRSQIQPNQPKQTQGESQN